MIKVDLSVIHHREPLSAKPFDDNEPLRTGRWQTRSFQFYRFLTRQLLSYMTFDPCQTSDNAMLPCPRGKRPSRRVLLMCFFALLLVVVGARGEMLFAA